VVNGFGQDAASGDGEARNFAEGEITNWRMEGGHLEKK